MTAYTTPNGRRYGDPARWMIYKSRWAGWIVTGPVGPYWQSRVWGYRPVAKYEPTYEAARNYLIQQLDKAQLT